MEWILVSLLISVLKITIILILRYHMEGSGNSSKTKARKKELILVGLLQSMIIVKLMSRGMANSVKPHIKFKLAISVP